MDDIKCQNFFIFIFSSKIRMKPKFSLSINQIMKSKFQYFHYFLVCIVVPYAFWFSYQQNMVSILISITFGGAVLIRGRRLFQCGHPKVWRLLAGRAYLRLSAHQRKYGIRKDTYWFIVFFRQLRFFVVYRCYNQLSKRKKHNLHLKKLVHIIKRFVSLYSSIW